VAGAGVEGLKAEVVKEEEIGAAEGFDQAWMAAVATAERQILAELRPAMVQDGSIVAASSVADGASQPTFPDAGWADQGQVVAGFDPVALGELLEKGAIETTDGAIVDVFDTRLLAQLRGAQAGRQALVPAP